MRHPRKLNGAAFTVVELILAISVASVLIVVMYSVTFSYYAEVARTQAGAELTVESQNLFSQMTEELRLADSLGQTNGLTDANAPSGGWQTSDASNILIIRSPAIDSSKNLIYDITTGYPYHNEYVYYLTSSKIYKRTIKNTSATGNIAVTTCPAASATASCPEDRIFSSYVDDLSFVYYDTSGAQTSTIANARSVTFSIQMSRKVFGRKITINNSTRQLLRNF